MEKKGGTAKDEGADHYKFIPWKVGDKVWLETTNLHMGGPKKLQMKRTRPSKVEEIVSCMTFCLYILSWWKIYLVFHASLLTSYV